MNVVIDIEANGLKPSKVWVIVCKEVDTASYQIFRRVSDDESEAQRFLDYSRGVTKWIGHNILDYDLRVLRDLLGIDLVDTEVFPCCTDTLLISKVLNYSRPEGHSLEDYGEELGLDKDNYRDFTKYSIELEQRCIKDVDINEKVYKKYYRYSSDPSWTLSLTTEHQFQWFIVNSLAANGFYFNTTKAKGLLEKVTKELEVLDAEIKEAFPPKEVITRTFVPKLTKFGTISKTSVPRSLHSRIHEFEEGKEYPLTRVEEFNPSSHKQLINILTEAGWKPEDKTKTHVEKEREAQRLKASRNRGVEFDLLLKGCYTDLDKLKKYGYKINEHNLSTLPSSAPPAARILAKRIVYESRRRTLTEWLGLVVEDTSRIHGRFYGIGAWTHRMAHQNPNTANIPNEFDISGKKKYLGKELRALWSAPRNRLLVGVDAEGIQLRIFAHYIDDKEFTESLVKGKKDDKTDPHSLNQAILGDVCKSRAAAKRFIYALLLGAGIQKLAEIMETTVPEAETALARLLERYSGFAELKSRVIPNDAARGWFVGLDGRKVRIPGETAGSKRHLCMSGYLQNGEAVIMKMAALHWRKELIKADPKLKWMLVDMVHDEWQTEVNNNMEFALLVAKTQADSLRIVGEQLKLKCPLAGSYWNEDHKDFHNWNQLECDPLELKN